jgi:5-methyltetrahydropteroyltriglutamate--homocysteine methyltransferase
LHVPYTLKNESNLKDEVKQYFSFALEKLQELQELSVLAECDDYKVKKEFANNKKIFKQERLFQNEEVRNQVDSLSEKDFIRQPKRAERQKLQKEAFGLPILPTTTIGSFPQTKEVKKNRSSYRKGEIDKAAYDNKVYAFIKECIEKQEEIGIDVLVHGEYERNDMVEFFGENLEGYVFTDKAWVQSYGTRCVKPPIIFGDVKRIAPITVEYSAYAQSLTNKPVKGMLTGPVTILNWSFPREDISLKEMAYQIGIAIRNEVLDLEKAGIRIIQIDEAALKEKLPIRKSDWYSEYLDWAIPAFRLCHSSVKAETQIHTHMCYSEFNDIINDIDNMDADVISFEASRSKLTILDAIKESNFETEVGPGVYDIHSPRVPSVEEIVTVLKTMLTKIDKEKLWVNPDCGLKTRGIPETDASLKNMVEAVKIVRR